MAPTIVRSDFPGVPTNRCVLVSSDLAVDVKAAAGNQSEWFDVEDADEVAVSIQQTALSGGSSPQIAYSLQHSPDKAAFFFVTAIGSNVTTSNGKVSDATKRTLHRYVRVSWNSSGAPTTATANI